MLPLLKQYSRVLNVVALATVGGVAVGFATFLTFSPQYPETEWRREIGVKWIALLTTSREALANSDDSDVDHAKQR